MELNTYNLSREIISDNIELLKMDLKSYNKLFSIHFQDVGFGHNFFTQKIGLTIKKYAWFMTTTGVKTLQMSKHSNHSS